MVGDSRHTDVLCIVGFKLEEVEPDIGSRSPETLTHGSCSLASYQERNSSPADSIENASPTPQCPTAEATTLSPSTRNAC